MKAQLRALYELQQVDLQLAAIRRTLAALDDGSTIIRKLSILEKQLVSASEELRKSESELKDNELNLKSIEAKKQSFEQKLYAGQVISPKELSSIEKEIEMLGKSRAKLDEKVLELYDTVDREQTTVRETKAAVDHLKELLAKHTADYKAKSSEFNAQIEQLTAARQKAIGAVTDPSLLQRYETIRVRYKDTGLAKVENGKCGGCHVGLTPYTQRMLKENTQYQSCESCGRILFLDE